MCTELGDSAVVHNRHSQKCYQEQNVKEQNMSIKHKRKFSVLQYECHPYHLKHGKSTNEIVWYFM